SDDVELICMVFLAEDEVPGEVSHQADMAGYAKFQSRADLTERSDVIVVNRISGQEFLLMGNETVGVEGVLLMKKLIESRATINEADAAGDIRSKAAERVASGQCDQTASCKIRFRSEAEGFDTGAKVFAPE